MVIKPLTGLRGLAALVVFFAHYAFNAQIPELDSFYYIFFWHSEAVDFFFVLSGFVLSFAYRIEAKKIDWINYISARISRIYPLYLFSLLFVAALGFLAALKRGHWASDLSFSDFIRQLLMINAFPFIGTGRHWNFPAWSISVEFFLYLFVFPIAVYISRIKSLLFISINLLCFSILIYGIHNEWFGHISWVNQMVLRGVFGFLSGSMVYLTYVKHKQITEFFQKIADVPYVVFLAIIVLSAYGKGLFSSLVFIFPVLILSFTAEKSLSAKLFATPIMVFLGDISYSVYLFHIPISKFILGLYPGLPNDYPVQWCVGGIFTVISTSAILYAKLELPAKKIFKTKISSIFGTIAD